MLLEDPDVRRWYDNLARGSWVTADVYLRRLSGFAVNQKIEPRKLLSLSDKEISYLHMDFDSFRIRTRPGAQHLSDVYDT
jgi:hypothetical protein